MPCKAGGFAKWAFHQPCHHFGGDPGDILFLQSVKLIQQVLYQQGDVFPAVAQIGQFQVNNANAII